MTIEDLKQPFSKELFLRINEDLIGVRFTASDLAIKSDNSNLISKADYHGNFQELDLHVISVQHTGSEDARVGVSLDIFKLMKMYSFQNAIVAAHLKTSDTWRYSLVTSNLSVNDKGKVTRQFSNPRRYSFVLGPNKKVLTPYQQLIRLGATWDLDELLKRFSLEVVNDEFYKEIAGLYDRLVGIDKTKGLIEYPSSGDELHEFAVRLIGRIIFCWFLREKKSRAGVSLVPSEILSRNASSQPNYYHKVLAPLFFEVLNKPISKRTDKFKTGFFADMPYLNGGLFSDDNIDYYKFDRDLEVSTPGIVEVPNSWLHELFDLLERYNFTVDENTSYDTDLSIDPEMLGRVFENLLARINPETGETVRKTTGSFYTPREIVDYMVGNSLKEYLKLKTKIKVDKINALVSYDLFDDLENELSDTEKISTLEALSELTVFDPACGSGAFPIGMLQKIVFIITRLDPNAEWWLSKQLEGTSPEVRKEFANRSVDYVRKLGIIRKTIFGSDIQTIATEISRLRCFLTLIVDEAVDDAQENRGIRPLPNLDFKFVTANSLLDIPKKDNSIGEVQGDMFEDTANIEKLKLLREEYFSSDTSDRPTLIQQFLQTQKDLWQGMHQSGVHSQQSLALSLWDPFSHNSTDWFDPEWMFGISKGFDIVIANPPYIDYRKIDKTTRNNILDYKIAQHSRMINLYTYFFEMGLKSLKEKGVLTYISPQQYLILDNCKGLRDLLRLNTVVLLSDFARADVFSASTYPFVTVIKKIASDTPGQYLEFNQLHDLKKPIRSLRIPNPIDEPVSISEYPTLIKKIEENSSTRLDNNLADIFCASSSTSLTLGADPTIGPPFLIAREIKEWRVDEPDKYVNRSTYSAPSATKQIGNVIYTSRMTNTIRAVYIRNNRFLGGKVNVIKPRQGIDPLVITALLNSNLINFWFREKFSMQHMQGGALPINTSELKKIPIALNNNELISKITKIAATVCTNPGTQELISQLNREIYALYRLAPEEIAIVEGMSKNAYK